MSYYTLGAVCNRSNMPIYMDDGFLRGSGKILGVSIARISSCMLQDIAISRHVAKFVC